MRVRVGDNVPEALRRTALRVWLAVERRAGECGDETQRAALNVLTALLELQLLVEFSHVHVGSVLGLASFDPIRARCYNEQLRFVLALLERTSLVLQAPSTNAGNNLLLTSESKTWREVRKSYIFYIFLKFKVFKKKKSF